MKYYLLVLLSGLYFNCSLAQVNTPAGIVQSTEPAAHPDMVGNGIPVKDLSGLSGIPCTPDVFWAVGPTGYVHEFQIGSGIIVYNGIIVNVAIPGINGTSLAFGDAVNGGSFSPTFFASDIFSTGYMFDGTSWIPLNGTTNCEPYNAAAYGPDLYYHFNGYSPFCIEKYTGSGFITLYTDTLSSMSVADIAIDDQGNIWFMTGALQTAHITTMVNVLSPSGQLLAQYPCNFSSANAYGCFILNGVLNIGLGSMNPVYPNTILPILLTQDSAMVGTPVPMPITITLNDLASCNPGNPLSLNDVPTDQHAFTVFPNPARDVAWIRMNRITGQNHSVTITDISGRNVLSNYFKTLHSVKEIKLDTSRLSSGMYFVRVKTGATSATGRLVIQ